MSDLPKNDKLEESLGGYLRRQREARGVSLELLSAITKIKVKNLGAMEENRFADLPSEPILRGFLRAYASEVGLDASEVLRRYESSPGRRVTALALPEWSDRTKTSSRHLRWVIVLGVSILLSAGVLSLFATEGWKKVIAAIAPSLGQKASKVVREPAPPEEVGEAKKSLPGDRSSSPDPSLKGTLALEEDKGQDDRRSAVDGTSLGKDKRTRPEGTPQETLAGKSEDALALKEKEVGVAPQNELEPLAEETLSILGTLEAENRASEVRLETSVKKEGDPGSPQEGVPLLLTIIAVEDTWLRVVVDGVEYDEVLLLQGRSREWKGREKFALTVGNRAGTRVALNGLSIELPRTNSNIVRNFLISKEDLP